MSESVESNRADPKLNYEHQWWQKLDDYHRQKVEFYLGKLVDCSKPITNEEWWSKLDTNDRTPTREIAENAKNLQVNPRASGGSRMETTQHESRTEFDGSGGLTPYKGIKVEGGFHVKRVIKTSSTNSTEYEDKETITFHQNTSEDKLNSHGHTKFEEELCDYLLSKPGIDSALTKEIQDIEQAQTATKELASAKEELASAKGKLESVKTKLNDVSQKMKDQDSVIRFEAFVKDNEEIWGIVANACYSFFARDKFSSTHYVHCITLGTTVQLLETSKNITKVKSIRLKQEGMEHVTAGGEAVEETDSKSESTCKQTRGTEDHVEVTAVTTREVSYLISDKLHGLSKLKSVVAELIKRQNMDNEGEEAGPFIIYCSKKKILGKPTKIYWQVVEGSDSPEILGTTNSKDASPFYIEYVKRSALGFYIVHKPDSGNPLYAAVRRPFFAGAPLQLWSATPDQNDQDICFTREATTKNDRDHRSLPDTTHKWAQQGPIFIKLPYGSGWINWIWKIERYVGIQENGKTYKTISYHKRPKEEKERDMWLFSFENAPSHGALGGPPPPPSSEKQDDLEDIIDWSDDGKVVDHNVAFYELVGKDYVFPFQVISHLH